MRPHAITRAVLLLVVLSASATAANGGRAARSGRSGRRGALRRGALYPLKRGNSAEPPGLIPVHKLVPTAESSYVMDLHPLRRGSGSKPTGTPCGLTSKVLGDLYGARKLNLVMDESGAAPPPPLGGGGGVEGQDCIGQDQQLREGDKGSGLVWLLGDPAKVPPPPAGDADAGGDAPG